MNPRLEQLAPYPFQRLRALFEGIVPPADLAPINLSIGEPKHPTPAVLTEALVKALGGLAQYPATQGSEPLRQACSAWLERRYGIAVDPVRQILPVNGSREALFSFAQAVLDSSDPSKKPVVLMPNPFYQIYEGAALLAGAEPVYVATRADTQFQPDWASVPESIWARTQLVFVCTPGNPTGAVMSLEDWKQLFELSDRYGFVIAADECYSEIWFEQPPLGGLEAAAKLGRTDFRRLVMFTSLSKRSNAPGLRSGFVAGDAEIMAAYLLYRTYHGSAMSPSVQTASIAAWNDEAHVEDNRAAYREKFAAVTPMLAPYFDVSLPDAGFYLWAAIPDGQDAEFARALYAEKHVTVLPGSYLGRSVEGVNPAAGRIRIALVAPLAECIEAAQRMIDFVKTTQ